MTTTSVLKTRTRPLLCWVLPDSSPALWVLPDSSPALLGPPGLVPCSAGSSWTRCWAVLFLFVPKLCKGRVSTKLEMSLEVKRFSPTAPALPNACGVWLHLRAPTTKELPGPMAQQPVGRMLFVICAEMVLPPVAAAGHPGTLPGPTGSNLKVPRALWTAVC